MTSKFTDKEKIAYYKSKAGGSKKASKSYTTYNKGYAKKIPVGGGKWLQGSAAEKNAMRKAEYNKYSGVVSVPKSYSNQGAGGGLGSNIGERIGSSVGGGLGKGVHMLIKHITGFGDYNVGNNSLMRGGMTAPQIVNSSNHGGVIVRHREYLGDISATIAFTLSAFSLNPGLVDSFPWLSKIAGNYEQYQWRGVVFEFNSLSSDAILSASTSSALGSVVMATEYNTLNPNFANKSEMENHEFSNSRKPSLNFMHPIECKRGLTSVDMLYVRTGTVPANADIRLYDLGRTQIATVGMQAASGVAGELWVTYEVELYKATVKLTNVPVSDIDKFDHFRSAAAITTPGSSPFYHTSYPYAPIDTLNLGGAITAANTYTFPDTAVGESFSILYQIVGDSTAVSIGAGSMFGGTAVNTFTLANASLTNFIRTQSGSTTAIVMFMATVTVVNIGSYFVFTTTTLPSNARYDLIVTKLPSGFTKTNDTHIIRASIQKNNILLNADEYSSSHEISEDEVIEFMRKKTLRNKGF